MSANISFKNLGTQISVQQEILLEENLNTKVEFPRKNRTTVAKQSRLLRLGGHVQTFALAPDLPLHFVTPDFVSFILVLCWILDQARWRSGEKGKSDGREKDWRLEGRGQARANRDVLIWKQAMNQSPIFSNVDFNILNCRHHY